MGFNNVHRQEHGGGKMTGKKLRVVEYLDGSISKYDENNNCVEYQDVGGFGWKRKFDKNNNCIEHKNSRGYWWKRKFDKNNKCVEYKNSKGVCTKENKTRKQLL